MIKLVVATGPNAIKAADIGPRIGPAAAASASWKAQQQIFLHFDKSLKRPTSEDYDDIVAGIELPRAREDGENMFLGSVVKVQLFQDLVAEQDVKLKKISTSDQSKVLSWLQSPLVSLAQCEKPTKSRMSIV